jgi:hypothetical protein
MGMIPHQEWAMFRQNEHHLQPPLFSALDGLPEKHRARLAESWAGVFYREFFCRLDEKPFAALYSDEASRPNIPVNVLVGLEALKAGFGWSDAEMYDAYCFDMQVRYALGYRDLGEGDFELRTMYNFRQRLMEHLVKTGENLLDQAFVQITDEQIRSFQLKTHQLRMDSTQIASNIREMTRLQLLVEVLQRVHRMLTEADQARYAQPFAPYMRGSSGQYVYHLRGTETGPHLQAIGELMHRLLTELARTYADDPVYRMLQRVFAEQFTLTAGNVQALPGSEIQPNRLCSPDDPEATYCRKGSDGYEGYVTNITETCAPENAFQLIVKVQTAPNTTSDSKLLVEAIAELKERTGVETLYNDATFCSRAADQALHEHAITQVPTGLRGQRPHPHKLNLSDFQLELTADGQPTQITCPQGQTVAVQSGRGPHNHKAHFAASACQACPLQARCPTYVIKQDQRRGLYFTRYQIQSAQRRQRYQAYRQGTTNPRAAIEATIGGVKHPFSDDQVPVRGRFRVATLMLGSAIMFNVRRIQRYLEGCYARSEGKETTAGPSRSCNTPSFRTRLRASIQALLSFHRSPQPALCFAG